jgi:hypothetical protein
MDAKPASSTERPAAHEQGGADGDLERYGPLALRRLRKDDGRALILYSRAGPVEGDGEAARPLPAPEK